MNNHWLIAWVITVGVIVSGCASQPDKPQASAAASPEAVAGELAEYRIGVDDVVQISVWRNDDLSVEVPVRPDGMISMPLIGDVRAGGLTATEVAQAIQKDLSVYIRDPQVAVILTQLRSHEFLSRIRVTGAVESAQSIAYRQGMTVLDAILLSGGLNEFASANRAKLYRKKEDGSLGVYVLRLEDIINRGQLQTNHLLIPGDIISVPERLF